MVSKTFFSALIALLVAQLASANNLYCPEPENSKFLVYSQGVVVPAPLFGRAEVEYVIPKPLNPVNCITLTGAISFPASIASLGFLDDGSIKIKLVSSIQQPMELLLNVYSEE